jgi:hypothetical protein
VGGAKDDTGGTLARLWRRGQRGWPQRYPVAQLPNAPLLCAMTGRLLVARTSGAARGVGRLLFQAGLAVWAWRELAEGVNAFRRLIGGVVLLRLIARLARRGAVRA